MLYYILLPLAWLVWHLGFRIEVIGRENLKKTATKGFILAPNHVSAIDPVFVVLARFWGRRMLVFAKKELFTHGPLVNWFMGQCGAIAVRGTGDPYAAVNQAADYCRGGDGLLIFPEGTREKEGELLPPKSGMFVVAAAAGVDVIPCRILYGTPDGKMRLFCRVRVAFGAPMPAAQFEMEEKRDVKKLRANKKALTEAWERLGQEHKF
jgi:1-acyl-sn-glycerol-3-phosphate acyltransferase